MSDTNDVTSESFTGMRFYYRGSKNSSLVPLVPLVPLVHLFEPAFKARIVVLLRCIQAIARIAFDMQISAVAGDSGRLLRLKDGTAKLADIMRPADSGDLALLTLLDLYAAFDIADYAIVYLAV